MKNSLYGAALVCAMLAACAPSKRYRIEGTAPEEYNGSYLYVLRHGNFIEGEHNTNTDSVLVENGRFVLEGEIEGDSLRFMGLENSSVDFIIEPGTIRLDLENGKNLGGTPLNDAMIAYENRRDSMVKGFNEGYGAVLKDSTLTKAEKDSLNTARSNAFRPQMEAFSSEYISTYKQSVLADIALYYLMVSGHNDVEQFDRVYKLMDNREPKYAPLKGAIRRIEAVRRTSAGQPFVDFTVKGGNLDGTDAKLSDYVGKGKFVLVDFWASWCGWCRAEFPVLRETYDAHKGEPFELVGIVVNDKLEATKKALSEEPLVVWPQIVNAGKDVMNAYGVGGIPEIILFAPDGTILARGLRGENLKKTVNEALLNQ